MHAHNPDDPSAPGPADRYNLCLPGTGRFSADAGNNNELRWTERYVPRKKPLFGPSQHFFRNTEQPGNSPQTTKEAYRKIRSTALRILQTPGSAIRKIFPGRSFRNVFRPCVEQRNSFRHEFIVHIMNSGTRIDTLEDRPGQGESQAGNARPVQERGRTDRPDIFRTGGNSR